MVINFICVVDSYSIDVVKIVGLFNIQASPLFKKKL